MRRERICTQLPALSETTGYVSTCVTALANLQLQTAKASRATSVALQSDRPAMEQRHTQNARNPLREFCKYFVAKIQEKAIKLEEAGTYSALQFKGNDWIMFVQWYECVSTTKNRRGDRF